MTKRKATPPVVGRHPDFEARRRFLVEGYVREFLPRLDRQQWLVAVEEAEARQTAASMDGQSPHAKVTGAYHEMRASTFLAVALAETGDAASAARIVMRVLDFQDGRPQSLTRGNFFWHSNWSEVKDPNCASFIVPHLAYLAAHYRFAFSVAEIERLESALALAAEALFMHRATWGYTNITLLNLAGKLAVGSLLRDERIVRLAYWDWEEWRNHTARSGLFAEWYSHTYTTVQIDALAMILTYPHLEPAFLQEVRGVLRQLITQSMLDFHPGIGRITGPQSRAYEPDRKWKHRSCMDMIPYLLTGDPTLMEGLVGFPWIGAEISEADLLPAARHLPLPRTTVQTSDFLRRTNHLAADYALGSIQMSTHLVGAQLPVFLVYKSSQSRCGMAFVPNGAPAGYWAEQKDGDLLAAVTWLLDRKPSNSILGPTGSFSGLRTGRPDTLNDAVDFRPALSVELGMADRLKIVDATGKPVQAQDGHLLPGSALAVETESIRVFLRFAGGAGKPPSLRLEVAADGDTVLGVEPGDIGKVIGEREAMALCGVQVSVEPRTKSKSLSIFVREKAAAPCMMRADAGGWTFEGDFEAATGRLRLRVPADVNVFYETEGVRVTPNQWALSLRESGSLEP